MMQFTRTYLFYLYHCYSKLSFPLDILKGDDAFLKSNILLLFSRRRRFIIVVACGST